MSAKDKSNPFLYQGVYQIPYSCGKTYIGQTGRSIQIHLKEHIPDTNQTRLKEYILLQELLEKRITTN